MSLAGDRITSGPVTDPLQIYIDVPKAGQPDSVVNLQWRVSEKAIQELKANKAYDAQLLIVVSNHDVEMERKLVPLQPASDFIWLKRPGDNVIHATIVWTGEFGYKPSKLMEMSKIHQGYYWRLLESRTPQVDELQRQKRAIGDQIRQLEQQQSFRVSRQERDLRQQLGELDRQLAASYDLPPIMLFKEYFEADVARLDFEAQISLHVPKEMFANSSWRLTKWLGGLFWQSRPKDQCHLRRRAIINGVTAFLWAPLGLLTALFLEIGLVFTLLFLGVAAKRPKILGFRHPWNQNPKRVWEASLPSFWWTKRTGNVYTPRHWLFRVINLPSLIIGSGVFYVGVAAGVPLWLPLTSVAAIVFGLSFGRFVVMPVYDKLDQRHEVNAIVRQAQEGAQLFASLQRLAEPEPVVINPLYSRRHAYLKFQEVKAKVCKPFAR